MRVHTFTLVARVLSRTIVRSLVGNLATALCITLGRCLGIFRLGMLSILFFDAKVRLCNTGENKRVSWFQVFVSIFCHDANGLLELG
jgi:hypothetical protein